MTYIPSPKQVEAHCATEQFLGFGGAMGGGKTRWLCEAAKLFSISYPGNFGLLGRQSGPALKVSTMEVFFDEVMIPGSDEWKELGCKYNKAEGMIWFQNLEPVSKIWFTGFDNDNIERIKSLNLGWFGVDEATEITESLYLMLCTRLRRKGVPREARKGMISANPEAGWVKRRFLDQKLKNHKFIQANYKDNPHLPEDYPQLFDTMPITWRKKYLDGNWGAVSGLIYSGFDEDFHVVPYTKAPPEWKQFRGFDHGQQNPAACLSFLSGYAEEIHFKELIGEDRWNLMPRKYDDYPVLICSKLYYDSGLVSKHRKEIASLWPDFKGPTYADPSIWAKDREKMLSDGKSVPYSIANEYLEFPFPLRGLIRANNIKDVGINRVSQLLEIGHLFFMDHPSMDPLIGDAGEIRSYSWKQPRTDDDDWPEEAEKKRDHAMDAMRYGVMSLPPVKVYSPKVIPYNSFMAARQRAIAFKKRSQGIEISKGRVVGV